MSKGLSTLALVCISAFALRAQSADKGAATSSDEGVTLAMASPARVGGAGTRAIEAAPGSAEAGTTMLLPTYPGGKNALAKAISLRLERPASAADVTGRVKLRARITASGEMRDVTVVDGLHPDCDAAAIEAVRELGNWEPAQLRGTAFERSVYLGVDF